MALTVFLLVACGCGVGDRAPEMLPEELSGLIRARLDAFARADAAAWALHVAEECFCGPSSKAEIEYEIRARAADRKPSKNWYGPIDALVLRRFDDTLVARYRVTEYTKLGAHQLADDLVRTETYVWRGQRWLLAAGADVVLANDPPIAPLGVEQLETLVGRYRYDADTIDVVAREGDHLTVATAGQPPEPIFPENETTFFGKRQLWRMVFDRDASQRVTGLRFRQNGHELVAAREP